jgi:hypothetical protein
MPLYVQDGKLLQKSGALGTSVGCCCSPPGCNCPEGPIEIPSSVTIEFSLGDFIPTLFSGVCTQDDAVAFIEGTYVLSPTVFNIDFIIYTLTTESGAEVSLKWYCNLGLSGQTADFSLVLCDLSTECFARTRETAFIFSGDLLGLCTYPENNVDTNTFDPGNNAILLEQGPLIIACSEAGGLNGRRYSNYILDITAAW